MNLPCNPVLGCIADDFTGFGADIHALKKRLRSEKRAKPPYDSFDEYAIQLRRELGIPHAQALELFYQTVSMKSVGNLTEFVRHHMLEPDDTDDRIRALIGNFENLNRAGRVLTGRRADLDPDRARILCRADNPSRFLCQRGVAVHHRSRH